MVPYSDDPNAIWTGFYTSRANLKKLVREEVGKLMEEVRNQAIKGKQKPKPLSIQDVCDRYEITKATVHNLMKKGTIKGFKMGKGRFFHLDEIEKSFYQYKYLEVLERKGLIEPLRKFY